MDYSRYQIYEFFFDLKQEFKMYRDSILDEYDYGPIYANLYNMPEKLVDIFWEEYIYPTIVPEDPPNIMSFDQNAKHNQIIDILEKEYYIENIDCPTKLSEGEFEQIYNTVSSTYRVEIARQLIQD